MNLESELLTSPDTKIGGSADIQEPTLRIFNGDETTHTPHAPPSNDVAKEIDERLQIEEAIELLCNFYFRRKYEGVMTPAEAIATVAKLRPRVRQWMEKFPRSLTEPPSCMKNGSWIGYPPTLEGEYNFREKGLQTVFITLDNVHKLIVEAFLKNDDPSSYALVSLMLWYNRQVEENIQWAKSQNK